MNTITVPRATWDALREALDTIIQYNRDHARDQYGDAEKAERWACVVKARQALTAANAVSEQKGLFVDLIASHGPEFAAEMAATEPQAQGESWVWNPASTEWEKVRAFGHWQQGAIYAFGSTQPEPLAHPQATEPADQDSLMEKAYERGWIECACWANRDDLRADVGSPAYLADRSPHLDAVKNGWPLGCEKCIDPDGIPCFPQYGVGPHTCFYKIPGAKVGESQPLPKDQWPDNYREDPDCPGMGVYWCPHCGSGKPAPEAKQ